MAIAPRIALVGLAGLASAGCINVDDAGNHHTDGVEPVEPRYGTRHIRILEPFESREDAGAALSETMDALRGAGCDIASADRWHEIAERDGADMRGMRVSADCPRSARLFREE